MAEHQTDQPRGIDHDRIEELTKEYRLQMEADPDDPIAAQAREESAKWADRVAQGRYPELEARNQQKRELLEARRLVKESTGRTTGLRQVDPGMSEGILSEPAGPPQPESRPEESLEELFASAEAPDQHVPRIDRQTAHDPALHPASERLARPEDELVHHGFPARESQPSHERPAHPVHERPAQSAAHHAPAYEASDAPERPRIHRRAINRVKSWGKRLRGH